MIDSMIIYTGQTALEFWNRYRRLKGAMDRDVQRYVDIDLPVLDMRELPHESPRVSDAVFESEEFRESLPIEVMVRDHACSVRSEKVVSRIRNHRFPKASFYEISDGISVISPELLFVEMASRLGLIELLLLGYELAGSYELDPGSIDGFLKAVPLLSHRALDKVMRGLKGYNGLRRARAAARYVLEHSASPMETLVALTLSLPRRLGGLGVPKPSLNHRIEIMPGSCPGYDKSAIVFDLFWESCALGLEYDSDAHHASIAKLHSDSKRRNAARSLGFDVLSMTSVEYANDACIIRMAEQVMRKHGRYMRRLDLLERSRMRKLRNDLRRE